MTKRTIILSELSVCVHTYVYMCEAERLPVSKHAALNEISSSAMSALDPEAQKACTLRWKLCPKQITNNFRIRAKVKSDLFKLM